MYSKISQTRPFSCAGWVFVHNMRMEEVKYRSRNVIDIEEGGWGRGYGGGRGCGIGGWSRIKYEVARIERVEHNTTIVHNIMNKYGIKYF